MNFFSHQGPNLMIFPNSVSFSTQRHLAPSFIYTHIPVSPLPPPTALFTLIAENRNLPE